MKLGCYYEYYKGGIYKTLYIARHTETNEILVICEDENTCIWARPLDMFEDEIEIEGIKNKRFSLLDKI